MSITQNLNEKKYVAFLDVLGFKEMVVEKGAKLDKYFETISTALIDINGDKPKISSQLVSDSTILACQLNNEDFRLLLKAIQTIQARCAVENIWLRGAISIGDIHFDNELNIVVGNGLSEAYILETQEKYPRIIIDPRVVKNSFGTRQSLINECNIKVWEPSYVQDIPLVHDFRNNTNYIETDALFVAFSERIFINDINNLDIIYNHIKNELYSNQKTYQKYHWLKNYFYETLQYLSDQSFFANFNNAEKGEIFNTINEYSIKFQEL